MGIVDLEYKEALTTCLVVEEEPSQAVGSPRRCCNVV
jgi:hypothetical protein